MIAIHVLLALLQLRIPALDFPPAAILVVVISRAFSRVLLQIVLARSLLLVLFPSTMTHARSAVILPLLLTLFYFLQPLIKLCLVDFKVPRLEGLFTNYSAFLSALLILFVSVGPLPQQLIHYLLHPLAARFAVVRLFLRLLVAYHFARHVPFFRVQHLLHYIRSIFLTSCNARLPTLSLITFISSSGASNSPGM